MRFILAAAVAAALLLTVGCQKKAEPQATPTESYAPLDTGEPAAGGGALTDANTGSTGMESGMRQPAPAPSRTVQDETLSPTPSAGGGRTYVVQKGDTMHSIARKHYGNQSRWKEVWNANKSRVKDPNRLKVGDRLIIP